MAERFRNNSVSSDKIEIDRLEIDLPDEDDSGLDDAIAEELLRRLGALLEDA